MKFKFWIVAGFLDETKEIPAFVWLPRQSFHPKPELKNELNLNEKQFKICLQFISFSLIFVFLIWFFLCFNLFRLQFDLSKKTKIAGQIQEYLESRLKLVAHQGNFSETVAITSLIK